jgi:hypothetical protein
MEVVSILSFGWCETMVLSRRRKCTWKLVWTSGQILFCVLSASSYLCSTGGSFDFPPKWEGINRCSMGQIYLIGSIRSWLVLAQVYVASAFFTGLDKESAHHLNITSRGSFAHLTPTEGMEILDKILDRTSFVCVHEPPSAEPKVRHEEVPGIESK